MRIVHPRIPFAASWAAFFVSKISTLGGVYILFSVISLTARGGALGLISFQSRTISGRLCLFDVYMIPRTALYVKLLPPYFMGEFKRKKPCINCRATT